MIKSSSPLNSGTVDDLPRGTWKGSNREIYRWQGFWYLRPHLKAVMEAQSCFQARDDDVLLASSMKTGTTWLKALIPCIMNTNARLVGDVRDDADADLDPLIKNHPNVLIPSLEIQVFVENSAYDIPHMPSPRIFRTHMPYSALPESIKSSDCKIVYITRDPKDTVVSLWHFVNTFNTREGRRPGLGDIFDQFCDGVHPFGPFHDHVLEYWNASLKRPQKILFMKYEDMKRDPKGEVKKLALFLGRPLEKEEEVEKVLRRCSLERLKSLEVNKNGVDPWLGIPKSAYFRQGIVGGWKTSLTMEMKDRIDEITHAKLEGSGLEL